MIVVPISRREQNISNAHTPKLGLRPPFCYFFADILSVRGTLMAQRPAPLNMNKPSSAETQAKPNSARRHHSRTGQEALELLLASRDKLHHHHPLLRHKPSFPKSIAHQKKDNGLEIILRRFFFLLLSDFQLSLQ